MSDDDFAPRPGEDAPQRWWNRQTEVRLGELHRQVDKLWIELREEIRRGDSRQFVLNRLDERMAEVRKSLDDLTKTVRDEMISQTDFRPYRNAAVLILTLMATAIIGAVLKLVIIG